MALVYHYCSPQTFLHIIEKKKIWLSSSKNMNDSAEGDWFSNAYHDFLKKNEDRLGIDFCDAALSKFSANAQPKYITCFSKDGDSLSQWRAYAQNGEGVALGFDDAKLGAKGEVALPNREPESSLTMIDVGYLSKEKIFQVLENIFTLSKEEDDINEQSFGFAITSLAYYLVVKNPAFHEEKEKRLIFSPLINLYKDERNYSVENGVGELKHRISNGYLTSHFEYEINTKEALKEIILGPRNKFSDYDVNNLLGFNGLKKITVKKSAATYR